LKENLVSIGSKENKIPEEAMNAFLDGILAELNTPVDPAMLTMVRAVFRKRIPLHLRSYAAALLIMRAAGMTRSAPLRPLAPQTPAPNLAKPQTLVKPQAKPRPQSLEKPQPAAKPQTSEPAPERKSTPAPKLTEATVPLFVSMGKRQRLRPQELRDLITEKTGILNEEMGRVHLFDNYSFIDIQLSHSEKVVAACDGALFKGRNIEIKPAKKRSDQAQEQEPTE